MAPVTLLSTGAHMTKTITITIESPVHGHRIWRRIGTREHINRDGRQVWLATWETRCVICDAPVTVTTRDDGDTSSGSFSVTTCPQHRVTPTETAKLRWARKDARKDVFEQIKVDKLRCDQNPTRA